MNSRSRLLLAVVAAVVVLTAATLVIRSAPQPGGPLAQEAVTTDVVPLDPGQDLTFGQVVLENAGTGVATIDSIDLIQVDPGIEVLGIRVLRRGDPPPVIAGTAYGFPPPGLPAAQLSDPAGFEVRPRKQPTPWAEDVEVVVGLRVRRSGLYRIGGIDVKYHVGATAYDATFRQSVQICAPRSAMTSSGCLSGS